MRELFYLKSLENFIIDSLYFQYLKQIFVHQSKILNFSNIITFAKDKIIYLSFIILIRLSNKYNLVNWLYHGFF